MAERTKAVLMVHTDQAQGELWQAALSTQQLDVIWQKSSLDLVQYLEQCDRQDLPDLLVIDMAIKSPSSETLQSSSVCQWLNKNKISTKVVLCNPRQEKIKDIEHSWAIRRGASDVIPRLYSDNLITEMARVTALMGCTLEPKPLEKIAKNLDSRNAIMQPKTPDLTASEDESVSDSKRSQTKNNSRSSQSSDESEVVMYRGVRIRR